MSRVEIDHTPLDIILIDEETGQPMRRPNLTAIIDCHSRCILGYYISYRAPSYIAAAKTILSALCPKNSKGKEFPKLVYKKLRHVACYYQAHAMEAEF